METDKRCRTCGWWHKVSYKVGECDSPYPWWVINEEGESFPGPRDGFDCPCWKPKEATDGNQTKAK